LDNGHRIAVRGPFAMNRVLAIRREKGMVETKQRAAERHRCWLKALFVFNDGRSSLDAIVRNLSDAGALLECEDMRLLPEEFDIIVVKASGEQARHRARQVWRHDGALGVKFIDDLKDSPRSSSTMAQAS
jgi:hypothetical protein